MRNPAPKWTSEPAAVIGLQITNEEATGGADCSDLDVSVQ